MKLLYFTTASDPAQYEKIQQQSRVKASVASQVFESSLLKGFSELSGIELTLHSFPMIAAFPGSKLLFWGAKKQKTVGGFQTKWLPTVNLYGLKQFSQRLSAGRAVRRWLKENRDDKDKAILLYSVYEPIAAQVLKYAKKYSCKTFVIVPDLPRDMYKTISRNPVMALMQKRYMKRAIDCQDKFDGYIYLTEAMSEVVAPGKPFAVIEGIADTADVLSPSAEEKHKKRSIMYAGALREDYGLKNLIEAFLKLSLPDTELWLFGAGNYVPQIEQYAADNETIKYFGRVSREEVLEQERKATLLVNVRDPKEAFTKYSFPSKTIEYMLSGTPLLTTKLSGIPKEYEAYLYCIDDNSEEMICNAMRDIFAKQQTLIEKGAAAQQFISREKNARAQAQRLTSFLMETLYD